MDNWPTSLGDIYIYPESQDTSMPSSAIAPENNVITIENDHDCRFG